MGTATLEERYAENLHGVFNHWSIRQAEYSTDLMFRSEHMLVPLYDAISRQAVLAANAERVCGFLGKKVTPQLAQEIGSRLSTRIEGRCIKHTMGAAGVKAYDKFSRVLRIETTVNDLNFFKHHRKVEHKDGHTTRELAPLKKTLYRLIDLREILLGCNQRYLASPSSLDDPSTGERDLQRLSQPRVGTDPGIKGLNFFDAAEQTLLRTLQLGKFNIHGWRRADLLAHLNITPSAMSRQLKRLHVLGLIKKVAHTYRYYLTRMGRAAIAAACSLTRFNIVPHGCYPLNSSCLSGCHTQQKLKSFFRPEVGCLPHSVARRRPRRRISSEIRSQVGLPVRYVWQPDKHGILLTICQDSICK